MSRWVRSMTVLVATSAALLGTAAANAHQPLARAAASCASFSGKYGYVYVVNFTVHGIGCSAGKTVIKNHGRGWRCSTKRLQTSRTLYDDHESCSSGSRRVQWIYEKNT